MPKKPLIAPLGAMFERTVPVVNGAEEEAVVPWNGGARQQREARQKKEVDQWEALTTKEGKKERKLSRARSAVLERNEQVRQAKLAVQVAQEKESESKEAFITIVLDEDDPGTEMSRNFFAMWKYRRGKTREAEEVLDKMAQEEDEDDITTVA